MTRGSFVFLSAYDEITYLIGVVNAETIVTSTRFRSAISRLAILLRVRISKVTTIAERNRCINIASARLVIELINEPFNVSWFYFYKIGTSPSVCSISDRSTRIV